MRKVIPGIKNLRNLSLKHAPVTHEDVYLAIKYGKYLSTVSVEGSLVDLKGYGRKASFVNLCAQVEMRRNWPLTVVVSQKFFKLKKLCFKGKEHRITSYFKYERFKFVCFIKLKCVLKP